MTPTRLWIMAKTLTRAGLIAAREKLRRNFYKWNRGETGKRNDDKAQK